MQVANLQKLFLSLFTQDELEQFIKTDARLARASDDIDWKGSASQVALRVAVALEKRGWNDDALQAALAAARPRMPKPKVDPPGPNLRRIAFTVLGVTASVLAIASVAYIVKPGKCSDDQGGAEWQLRHGDPMVSVGRIVSFCLPGEPSQSLPSTAVDTDEHGVLVLPEGFRKERIGDIRVRCVDLDGTVYAHPRDAGGCEPIPLSCMPLADPC